MNESPCLSTFVGPNNIIVHGCEIDKLTKCIHWHSDKDIIAIKFKCCNKYYSCYSCHEALETHAVIRWSLDDTINVIICGSCGSEMSIDKYLNCNFICPNESCKQMFNHRCSNHYHLYFDLKDNS